MAHDPLEHLYPAVGLLLNTLDDPVADCLSLVIGIRLQEIRCAELDATIQDYVARLLDQALAGEAEHEDKARACPKERRR